MTIASDGPHEELKNGVQTLGLRFSPTDHIWISRAGGSIAVSYPGCPETLSLNPIEINRLAHLLHEADRYNAAQKRMDEPAEAEVEDAPVE